MSDIKLAKPQIDPPKPIGRLSITNEVHIAIYEPINWFHRLMMRLILGWKYKEVE